MASPLAPGRAKAYTGRTSQAPGVPAVFTAAELLLLATAGLVLAGCVALMWYVTKE